jgi:PPOX class probable F420-dependent enzyme
MVEIPERGRQIIDKKSYAHVATLMADGSPQVTPVWVERDGDLILINSHEDRLKPRNLRRDERVAVSIQDPDEPLVALIVRGRAAELTHDGADEDFDRLAHKYTGHAFAHTPGQQRVTIRIEPEHVLLYDA